MLPITQRGLLVPRSKKLVKVAACSHSWATVFTSPSGREFQICDFCIEVRSIPCLPSKSVPVDKNGSSQLAAN